MNERLIILETLLETDKDDSPAGNVIKQVMDKYAYLPRHQRAFIRRVIEGTIERRIELDHIIDSVSKTPVAAMKPVILTILRMSVYQLKYMDSIPASAVCNEAVKLAVKKGFSPLKGFVNGVLRNISRNMDSIEYPPKDTKEGLSVRCSCPMWLAGQLIDELGFEKASLLLEASLKEAPVYIRTNLSKISTEDLMDRLSKEGAAFEKVRGISYALKLTDPDRISDMKTFRDGLFTVQDIGSMLVTHIADIKAGDTVFDVCAAPGGKSMHALDCLAGTGHLYSFDVSDNRLSLIKDNIARIGYDNVDVIQADATKHTDLYEEKADVLIADLPCSGLGVMGRKNDIKYNISAEKENSLITLQREILENVSKYVKPGGRLIFSTCTVHRGENEDNAAWIRENLPFESEDFSGRLPEGYKESSAEQGYIQLIPGIHECDGFFISSFVKKR